MSEKLVTLLSKTNEHDSPYLGNCKLVVGDGTQNVEFRNGRAEVPLSAARLFARHPHVEIPGLELLDLAEDDTEPTVDDAAAQTGDPAAPPDVAFSDGEQGPVEVSQAVKDAMEHLAADGVEIPEIEGLGQNDQSPPAPAREGWTPGTVDGQPRCQAAKGDGTQCSNPAREGAACQLASHKKQLAA